MTEFELSCWYERKRETKSYSQQNNKAHYKKHCPRAMYLFNPATRVHPEMLDQVGRDMDFMDRSQLVCSNAREYWRGLAHKRPWPYQPGMRFPGFDHTVAWRRQRERFPCLVTTEPYKKPDLTIWYKMAKENNYSFRLYERSEHSLWNSGCYMGFWWCPKFWEPDFKKIWPFDVSFAEIIVGRDAEEE